MRKTVMSFLICSLIGMSLPAQATEQMKPGLWEMAVKSDAFKKMPKMSAEQMDQMRRMGVNVPQMQDGAIISKVCITKEMAERGAPPVDVKENQCQPKNHQRSGNQYSVDIVCEGPDIKGTGKAKGTFSSNTSFTSTYDFKGTAHGQPISSRHETSGKWLAADCGSVKPLPVVPPAK